MTKTTSRSSFGSRLRPRIVGAAIALLGLGACSTAAGDTTTSQIATPAPPTSAVSSAPETTQPATSPQPDAASLLDAALDAYRVGYAFTATTTVNGEVASTQSGRWIGDASQMTVQSGDGEVEYIITADGQWARLPDGVWEELDGSPSISFPLTGLATPDSLEISSVAAGRVQVTAVYPASAVGLTGEPIPTQLTFVSGQLVEAEFAAEIEGNLAESVTILDTLTDTTPITAPSL